MSNIKQLSPTVRVLVAVVAGVVALLPAVWLARYSMYVFDEAYQMLLCEDPANAPLSPLSARIGGLYCSLTGYSWLAARYYALGCVALAVVAATLWLWRRTRNYPLCVTVGAVCLYLATVYRSTHITFGWDNLTLLSTVLIAIAMLDWLRRPRQLTLTLIVLLSAFAVLVRIPNVSVVAVVAVVVAVRRPRAALLYVLLTAALDVAGITLLFGSPAAWMRSLAANTMDHHTVELLLWQTPYRLMTLMLPVALMYCAYLVTDRAGSRRLLTGLVALAWLGTMYFFLKQRYTDVEYIFVAFMFLAAGATFRTSRLATAAVLLLAVAPCAGSNTDLLKTVVWPMMPLMAGLYAPVATRAARVFVPVTLLGFMAFAYSNVRYGVLIGADMWDNLDEATAVVPEGRAAGMHSTPERVAELTSLHTDAQAATADGSRLLVLRRGGFDYIYEYILDARNPFLRHSFAFEDNQTDPTYITQIERRITEPGPQTVVYMRPDTTDTPMERMLRTHLTPVCTTPQYIIFK